MVNSARSSIQVAAFSSITAAGNNHGLLPWLFQIFKCIQWSDSMNSTDTESNEAGRASKWVEGLLLSTHLNPSNLRPAELFRILGASVNQVCTMASLLGFRIPIITV